MFAVNTYEQIEQNEKSINENHIIVLLFVRPSVKGAEEIINEFNYLHYNSSKYCSIYAVGYTNSSTHSSYSQKVVGVDGVSWYYSDNVFIDFKEKLEKRIKWKYSGENEMIVLQSNINGSNILNFQNYIAINISEGLREEYIASYPLFMENLIECSKSEVEAKRAINNASRFGIKSIAEMAIEDSQKIPSSAKKIIKNKIFFKTSRSYS